MPDVYYVYIMASVTGTLYIGFTNDLHVRVLQHKQGLIEGFSKRYKCDRLVYFEEYGDPTLGIRRETELKGWRRARKVKLIEKKNPRWTDLAESWGEQMLFKHQSIAEASKEKRVRLGENTSKQRREG